MQGAAQVANGAQDDGAAQADNEAEPGSAAVSADGAAATGAEGGEGSDSDDALVDADNEQMQNMVLAQYEKVRVAVYGSSQRWGYVWATALDSALPS